MRGGVHGVGEGLVDDFLGNSEGKLEVESGHGIITNVPECARTYNYKSFLGIFVQEIVLVAVGLQVSLQLVPLLPQVARQLVVHVVEQRKHRRVFMLVAAVKSLSNVFTSCSPLLLLIRNGIVANTFKELGETFNWIVLLPPFLSFVLASVQSGVVGCGVVTHPVGHELQEVRLLVLENIFPGLLGSIKASQSIVSIDSGTSYSHRNSSRDHAVRCVLIFHRGRNSVFVVTAQK